MENPSQPKLVTVIIPARDEANAISKLILQTAESLSGLRYEIIVVDDGSSDDTGRIARVNGTIVISHERTLGKGAAMKTGAQSASGDIIVFLDGDGAHDPRDILKMMAPLSESKADLVIGSRALPESDVHTYPIARKLSNNLASFTISFIISLLIPLTNLFVRPFRPRWQRITDCTSGFRAIKKGVWQKLDLTSQGFQIETEMIYETAKNGFTIAEVPICCNWDSRLSRLSVLRDGSRTLKLLSSKLANGLKQGNNKRHAEK